MEFGGENKMMMEAFADLSLVLVFAVVLVYMVMAAQFESLLHPFTIMFSMPLAMVGGVVLGLAVTGTPVSVLAAIGVVVLAGVVVNNAIVLVDYINILRKRGLSAKEAILTAGPTRLRPILMTTLTTVLGLVPLALGAGEGGGSAGTAWYYSDLRSQYVHDPDLNRGAGGLHLVRRPGSILTRRLPWLGGPTELMGGA